MTGSTPDPRTPDDDLDPTGVRALLANLPDPGPMPDELMARISQSLELEQRRRAAHAATAASTEASTPAEPADGAGGSVVSLDTERARRRPGRTILWLGGAAAVAMVATLSVNQLVDGDSADSGVAANVPASSASDSEALDEAEDAGAADEGGGEDGAAAGDAAQPEPPALPDHGAMATPGGSDAESAVQITTASGTVTLSASGWAQEADSWLADNPGRGQGDLTLEQAADCLALADLDTRLAPEVVMARATWDDQPGMLVVTEGTAASTGWVLSPDCLDVLSGPVPLG